MNGARRGRAYDAIESLIDFGIVTATKIASETKSVLATLLGAEDDERSETASDQILSVDAALLSRPMEPTTGGACEVFFVRRGDERIVLTTRDARWQVDLEEGEAVLRAFGDSRPLLRLKPDGRVIVIADGDVLIGTETASKALALAEKVEADLATVRDRHNGHTHTVSGTSTGAPLPPNLLGPTNVPPEVFPSDLGDRKSVV